MIGIRRRLASGGFGYASLVCAACVWTCAPIAAAAPAQDADDEPRVAMIRIEGAPAEAPEGMAWLFGSEHPTLAQLVGALDEAAQRDEVDSVLIQLDEAVLNQTQVEELATAIDRVQEAGKPVAVYAYAYSTPGLLLGAAADTVIVQAGGAVSLPGLYMEQIYLGDTLRWIGMEPQFVQIGKYKGASEMFMNAEPSDAWNENISRLLDGLYANVRAELREGLHMTEDELDEAMRRAWMADADTAIDVGLVDAAVDLPQIGAFLNDDGGAVEWVTDLIEQSSAMEMSPGNPMAAFEMLATLMNPPEYEPTGPTIAVLHITGTIVDGESTPAGPFGGASTGSRTIRNALETILDDDRIKGVVVRIDSPGGSAIASEVIWRGLRRVAKRKPVWASVGSMAASGAYYSAVGTDKIYVNPSSIVGSIGVVGGKISPAGLFDKLKINTVGRARGPMAGMFGTNPWTPEQIAMVREKMKRVYDLFVDRVQAGRPGIDISVTGAGRIFTGDKAIEMKMADEIGGLERAVSDMAAKLGLDEYETMSYPAPKDFASLMEDMFSFLSAPRVGAHARTSVGIAPQIAGIRTLLGGPDSQAWRSVQSALEGLMLLRREPVLLLMPRAIVVR